MNKGEEINNMASKENPNQPKLTENDEYVLSEWQAPKNKTGFFIFLVSSNFLLFLLIFQKLLILFFAKSDIFSCFWHCFCSFE